MTKIISPVAAVFSMMYATLCIETRICDNIDTIVDKIEGFLGLQHSMTSLTVTNWFPTSLHIKRYSMTIDTLVQLLIRISTLTSLSLYNLEDFWKLSQLCKIRIDLLNEQKFINDRPVEQSEAQYEKYQPITARKGACALFEQNQSLWSLNIHAAL
ncbi:hypothetical protein BDA99DRAFT_538771 [Phascolomyces articulosus]|uniref:Uncharacterized protein n=1 Tax=Phascolomyces articulosus TaxID=60185 RepID=A0AAD5PE68_9FUNG|nr:hypothetical protein BDA99DRAFT_538771 [Phascolomyces articulosus]